VGHPSLSQVKPVETRTFKTPHGKGKIPSIMKETGYGKYGEIIATSIIFRK
jgi:hypothetical protein